MATKLNRRDIKEALSLENSKAFAQINLRHEAEYVAKGLKRGDDPSLDKKFDAEKDALIKKMDKREQWIKELEATDKYDQITNELNDRDPYGLKHDVGDVEEPDAQSDYFKGLKLGHDLEYYDEQLADQIISHAPNDDKGKGMRDGQEFARLDKELDREKSISLEIWEQMEIDISQPSDDQDKDREQGLDRD